MPIDIKPGTPGHTLQRLAKKLSERNKELEPIFQRYEGNAPLPDSMKAAPESARVFFKAARTGFAELVVKSVKYALNVQSIATAVASTDQGDDAAHDLFVRSGMSDECDDVHRLALVAGNGYAMVGKYRGETAYTAEDPRQVVTIHDPVRQRIVLHAAKFWHDDENDLDIVHFWTLEGEHVRLRRATRMRKQVSGTLRFSASSWDWSPVPTEDANADLLAELPDPEVGVLLPDVVNEIPVYRYRDEEGVGEFQRHIDILNRLDHMVLQGLVIATLQAFRQRAIKVPDEDMPDTDEDGQPIDYDEIFSADPGALWKLPASAELWESGQVDLTPVWTGVDKFTQQFSAVTFTPLSVFSVDGANNSAKGVDFQRETRTLKVKDRQRRFGAVHARALAMMFRLEEDSARSDAAKLEVQWGPAEMYSLSERHDAAVKAKASGVPWRTRMIEVLQFTPKQVARMAAERLDDELVASISAQPPDATSTTPASTVPTDG